MSMSLTVLVNAILRFTFVFVFKTFPIMMDNFLSFFIKINILFWVFLSVVGKHYVEEKIPVAEKICNGTPISQDQFGRRVSIGAWVCILSAFGYFFVTLCIKIKNNQTHQNNQHTDFGSLFNSTVAISAITFPVICFILLNGIKSTEDLEGYPGWFYLHGYYFFGPFLLVISNCVVLYGPNPHLRRAVRRIFIQDRILTVLE